MIVGGDEGLETAIGVGCPRRQAAEPGLRRCYRPPRMWTRSASACGLAALALAVLPAPAGAQGLSDLLESLTGQTTTSTTPAQAPEEQVAPTETAPTATAPAAPAPPADATAPTPTPAPAAGTPTPAPPGAEQPGAGVSEQPIVAAAEEDRGTSALPAALVALAVLAVLVLLGVVAWALARWFAWDPRWLRRWRHASREAAYRASGVWDDFTDWVRLGR